MQELYFEIPNDALAGIQAKARFLREFIAQAAAQSESLPSAPGALGGLVRWVRSRVRYQPDPLDADTFRHPDVTLELGEGDCDDLVTLAGALAERAGYRTRLVFGADYPPRSGGDWQHVWLEVQTPRGWVTWDPSAKTPHATRMMVELREDELYLPSDYYREASGSIPPVPTQRDRPAARLSRGLGQSPSTIAILVVGALTFFVIWRTTRPRRRRRLSLEDF